MAAPLGLMVDKAREESGMPRSLSRVLIHLVFSTKNREALIPAGMRPELHAYVAAVPGKVGCPSIRVGGIDDHVHVLYSLSRTLTLASVTEKVKTSSSKWMKQRGVASFSWQAGYGAFSVCERDVRSVSQYIEHQEAHHAGVSFQDEMRHFFRRNQLEYDERYVWD
jgi:REP element-mobilizing transposase RayT